MLMNYKKYFAYDLNIRLIFVMWLCMNINLYTTHVKTKNSFFIQIDVVYTFINVS